MEKVDLKQQIAAYRARTGRFDVVDVPAMDFVMIDGHGDPNDPQTLAGALECLYPVSYTLKFTSRRELGRDYVVMPLEGLWWADGMDAYTTSRDRSRWDWTVMIMTPGWIGPDLFVAAVEQVGARRGAARLGDVRLGSFAEGRCVQTLHVGSFDDEAPVLARMHRDVIPDLGLRMVGKHHEIYLNDPRRTAPEKLRTILRQPVGPGSAPPPSAE